MRIDKAAFPFIAIAALPAVVSIVLAPVSDVAFWLLVPFGLLPFAVALFFRDPDRTSPSDPRLVLSPADGKVIYAGEAQVAESPPGRWRQVTIFLSLFDVHINRTPAAGRVTRVEYLPGSFRAAYHASAHANERSEIWLDAGGVPIVFRQVVGVLARRVVCRVKAGDRLAAGERIGLMKFGSRMDVFVPLSATLAVARGDTVRAGDTVIARLAAS